MSKLYPPYIEGTIPSFCENDNEEIILKVPFAMNQTVSIEQIWGFALRIKTV
jgi:hypothetical protein